MERIFLSKAELEKAYSELSKGLVMTKGEYRIPPQCSVDDLDWNHMDWAHRPKIHNTYLSSVRIFAEANFALSLTQLNFFGLKVFVQVSDVKLGKGLFYQCYTVFGLIYVHGMLENKPDDTCFSWMILSPWWLKPLHSILSKKLFNLNHVQIAEDIPLRKRRSELQTSGGYAFPPAERDFVTSNDGCKHTQYPELKGTFEFNLQSLGVGKVSDVSCDSTRYVIEKRDQQTLNLWPEVCPHEGGPLEAKSKCADGTIECPWHGLKFKPVKIGAAEVRVYGARFVFRNEILQVNPN